MGASLDKLQGTSKTAAGAASLGNFAWTVPGQEMVRPPAGGVTEAVLGRLGFAEAPAKPGSFNTDNVGAQLLNLGPQQVDQLRRQLYTSGLMQDKFYGARAQPMPFGQPLDGDTVSAFASAAQLATFTGSLDVLLSAKAPIGSLGAQGPVKQPLVIELPSETDLHAVLKESAMPLIGRDPTDKEMADFAKRFQSQSAAYQRAAYSAGGSGLPGGPGGTVTKPPSGAAAAEEFLEQGAPVEAGAQRMEKGLTTLLKMFSGGA